LKIKLKGKKFSFSVGPIEIDFPFLQKRWMIFLILVFQYNYLEQGIQLICGNDVLCAL